MNLLAGLTTDNTIADASEAVSTGSVLTSNVYDFNVDLAYISKSTGGAIAINLHLSANGQTLRQTVYASSGDAKGNKNFYTDKNGKKQYLPGFNVANNLALLTAGKPLSELVPEQKVANLYDYDAGKELPTKIAALTEIMGKPVSAGIIKQTVDKKAKTDSGEYEATGETRDENEIDRLFRTSDGLTVTEIKAAATDPAIKTAWLKKNFEVTKMKAKGAVTGAVAGMPAAAAQSIPSLFGNVANA